MPYAVLEKQLKALPEEYLEDVAKDVELLQYKVAAESACQPQKRAVVPGLLAGKFTLPDDIHAGDDIIADEFEEYL